MFARGRLVLIWGSLQMGAAQSAHAESPDAGSSDRHLHDDDGDHRLHEQEQTLSRRLAHDAKQASPSTADAGATSPWVSATVGRDGIAHFEDRTVLSTAHAATWYDQQYNHSVRKSLAPVSEKERTTEGTYDPVRDAPLVSLRFRFDLFDLTGDRNQAARAQFVDVSARQRTRLSLQDRLCSSLDSRALKEYLNEVLPKLPAPAHKHALLETHDACADSALGSLARILIQQSAQQRFPRQSEGAFTPAELKTFNEQRATSCRFEPYDD